MTYIVTHTGPDWDAIMSCWLLQRFGPFAEAEVRFVNTGAPDAETLAGAAAVVDTGREYDPARWRFDHHHMAPGEPANTCAAEQVAMFTLARREAPIGLWPLVNLVWAGDIGSGRDGADWSRSIGLHAALSGAKARGLDDAALLAYGYTLLDDVAAHLRGQAEARAMLDQVTVWKSADGLVWAIQDGGPQVTRAAGELGARLVVYGYTKEIDGTPPQYGMGLWRCGGAEVTTPHCGAVVATAISRAGGDLKAELSGWFLHPVGFCALSGSDKAPRMVAPAVSVIEVAQAISEAWQR